MVDELASSGSKTERRFWELLAKEVDILLNNSQLLLHNGTDARNGSSMQAFPLQFPSKIQ